MNQYNKKKEILNSKTFLIATLLSLITACGGGSSGSGGNKKVSDCFEFVRTENFNGVYRNVCPFAVNVRSAGSNNNVISFSANTTKRISSFLLVPGVCRAPSEPIEVTTEGFKCS